MSSRTVTRRLKVTLADTRPPIWRRVDVPGGISLAQFHRVLQIVMGWSDSHLHEFEKDGVAYGVSDREFGVQRVSERSTRLDDVLVQEGDVLVYLYDFGDSWCHKVLLESIVDDDAAVARVLAARRACPPDDCGGTGGYQMFLEALADSTHPDHAQMMEWCGGGFDADAYDIAAVNARLAKLRLTSLPAVRGRRAKLLGRSLDRRVDAMVASLTERARIEEPQFVQRLNAKLRNPASILSDREVQFLAVRMRRALGSLASAPGAPLNILEDMTRWHAVRAMCERARAERSLSTKDAAKALKAPHYKIKAVEEGPGPSFTVEHAVRYFRFLGIETWFAKWARANHELARRVGLG